MRLGSGYSKAERTGELVATATDGVGRLDAYVGRYLPQVVLSALVPERARLLGQSPEMLRDQWERFKERWSRQ